MTTTPPTNEDLCEMQRHLAQGVGLTQGEASALIDEVRRLRRECDRIEELKTVLVDWAMAEGE
jgi:hypothetical protein